MTAPNSRIRFVLTLALFAALAFFAWNSGRKVFEEGPDLEIVQENGAVVLHWAHEVEAPMAERFAAAFKQWESRTDRFVIDLNSPGGVLTEGRLVIAEIERMKATHEVDAYVGAGADCLSMCVPIYLAGDRRTAARDARFMFHEPSSYDFVTDEKVRRPGFEQKMTSDKFFERYFGKSEMNPEWRDKLRAGWRGRDLWFTAEELIAEESGVVEEVE